MKKILLIVPAETASGGIKNYFKVLKGKFTLPVEYIERGARNWPYRKGIISEVKRMLSDFNTFRKKINTAEYALVQTSTSLGLLSLIRDGLFLFISYSKGVRTIVFFRGWNKNVENKIEKYYLLIFKKVFFKADLLIVLSPDFKQTLEKWGYKKEIVVETTLIDSELIKPFNIHTIIGNKQAFKINEINILFLARTEVAKGIYEAIDAYVIVKQNNPDKKISLTIAGDGTEFKNMKNYISANYISDINVLGHIEADKKAQAFLKSDIYLFPSYTEGMPNSVLEAMAFGIPVVSSAVGAIPFIIKNGMNGFVTHSSKAEDFAELVQKLISDPDLRIKIAENNFLKAKEEFYSEKVVKRLEKIFLSVLNRTTITDTQYAG